MLLLSNMYTKVQYPQIYFLVNRVSNHKEMTLGMQEKWKYMKDELMKMFDINSLS